MPMPSDPAAQPPVFRQRLSLAATTYLPWLGLLVLGLAVTLGMVRGGACAAIGIAGGILLYAGYTAIEFKLPKLDFEIATFIGALFAAILLLDLNAVYPEVSWRETWLLATILLPLSLLACPAMQRCIAINQVLRWWPLVLATGAILLGALLVELHLAKTMDEYRLTKYNRGLSYGLLLCWPAMAMLWLNGRRGQAAALFATLLPALYLTHSRATQVATILALLIFAAAKAAPVATRRGLTALLALSLGWPFWAQTLFLEAPLWVKRLPDSWRARMEIWDFMSYRIMERPLLGWGIGGSQNLSPALPHGELYEFTHTAVAHPHNAITQLWVEIGLPGLVLGAGFAFLMLRRAGRLQSELVPFALAGWISAFCLSLCAYDLRTDSLLATFALTAFAFALAAAMAKKR